MQNNLEKLRTEMDPQIVVEQGQLRPEQDPLLQTEVAEQQGAELLGLAKRTETVPEQYEALIVAGSVLIEEGQDGIDTAQRALEVPDIWSDSMREKAVELSIMADSEPTLTYSDAEARIKSRLGTSIDSYTEGSENNPNTPQTLLEYVEQELSELARTGLGEQSADYASKVHELRRLRNAIYFQIQKDEIVKTNTKEVESEQVEADEKANEARQQIEAIYANNPDKPESNVIARTKETSIASANDSYPEMQPHIEQNNIEKSGNPASYPIIDITKKIAVNPKRPTPETLRELQDHQKHHAA